MPHGMSAKRRDVEIMPRPHVRAFRDRQIGRVRRIPLEVKEKKKFGLEREKGVVGTPLIPLDESGSVKHAN